MPKERPRLARVFALVDADDQNHSKDSHMSKLGTIREILTGRNAFYAVVAAVSMLAGCVATVRVPGPTVYAPPPPPPPPPPSASIEVAAPGVAVEVQATEPPPALPDYQQPPCPEDGYLWTPGYWAFSTGGYYWIPGTWVAPPAVGVLWTPGYWGFVGGVYRFNAGYWGPHVGFYGGVNYGFGYGGVGFGGGLWVGGHFSYNTAVVNVNTTVIHNTYVNRTVINNTTINRTSFNGPGGVAAQPTAAERTAAAEHHIPPTVAQTQHVHEALSNPQLSAKANGGHPAIAATARPGAFSGPGVVGAKGAPPLKPVTPPAHTPPTNAARPLERQHEQMRPTEPAHPQTTAPRTAAHPAAVAPKVAPKAPPKPAPKPASKPKPEDKNQK
jgi:hypothetical protein